MKFISSIVAGIIIGSFGVYFTLDWQEEKLKYSITLPAKFGNINYQNLTLRNDGWNPALNVKMYINHSNIAFDNMQTLTSLNEIEGEKNGIASIERVRRNESIVISLAYEGLPLSGGSVRIVSDRSIADLEEVEEQRPLPFWVIFLLWLLGAQFVIGVLAGIIVPSYKDYVKRSKEYEQKLKEKDV